MFFPLKYLNCHAQENKDISACMQREAEPTQHNHSATTTALAVTGDRVEKLHKDRAAQTRHSTLITKHSTDSVSSKGRNLLTGVKEHLCCIKGCNNFLSTISVRVKEDILFLR